MLDATIDPQSLAEEIIAVLRACGGPTLRSAVRERCKLAGSADYFSGEFGKLVSEGRVLAVGGAGPRICYQLGQAHTANTPKAATLPPRPRVIEQRQIDRNVQTAHAKGPRGLGETRAIVLNLLSEQPRTATAIARQLRITDESIQYHFKRLLRDGLIRQSETRGVYQCADQQAIEAPAVAIPPPPLDDLVVRVKLKASEVTPFFAFMKTLRAGSEVAA